MDQQPKIPTLKDAQKPQVKIKGLGAGLTLFDRLKQFKKKDLAFILAGLGTLFMAPLAEHFMMSPESGDHTMQKGWGGGSGSAGGNFFGSGSSPYESGNNSIASGGAIGGGGDIITPLNARDPSSLVMGPSGMHQPPAGSAVPATPPAASRSETDYKDALAGAAGRAASAAIKKAPLPIPKIAVGGSGLRGLGVVGGGSSASSGMGALNSGNLGKAGTGGGGLNLVRSNPSFRGAANPRGNAPQGLDGTKKAGQNAGDAFSRTGSAMSGLNEAASQTIPTGGKGFDGSGQGGAGANDKNPGGGGAAGSKSVGESLAFLEAKQRQEERLKSEFEMRKLKDPELLMYGIRNEVLKAGALKMGEALTKDLLRFMNIGQPPVDNSEFICGGISTNLSGIPLCSEGGGKDQDKPKTNACYWEQADGTYDTKKDGGGLVCRPTGKGKGETPPPKIEPGSVSGIQYGTKPSPETVAEVGVKSLCSEIKTMINAFTRSDNAVLKGSDVSHATTAAAYTVLLEQAAHLLQARNSLKGGYPDALPGGTSCGGVGNSQRSVNVVHPDITKKLAEQGVGAVPLLQSIVPLTKDDAATLDKVRVLVTDSNVLWAEAADQLKRGTDSIGKVTVTFAVPPGDLENGPMATTLAHANTVKGELVIYANHAGIRQGLLKKGMEDVTSTAAVGENSSKIMGQNDEFEKMKQLQPPAPASEPNVPSTTVVTTPAKTPDKKTYEEVAAAINEAASSITLACDSKNPCALPTPPPLPAAVAEAEKAEKAQAHRVTQATIRVTRMRDAQLGYLGEIQTKVFPGGGVVPVAAPL